MAQPLKYTVAFDDEKGESLVQPSTIESQQPIPVPVVGEELDFMVPGRWTVMKRVWHYSQETVQVRLFLKRK